MAVTMMKTLVSLLLATVTVLQPAATATAFSVQQEHSFKPNDGVYVSSRRNLLQSISATSALSLGPAVAASAALEEEDASVEFAAPKIGGVSLVGWAAAAVILNDVLSNRFSVDSIDGIVPEKDDDDKTR